MKYAAQGVEDIGESDRVHHPGGLTVLTGVTVTVCVFLEDESSATRGILRVQTPGVGCVPDWGGAGGGSSEEEETYSTCLDQEGGLLMVMNTQLVRMVTMMNMLNSVGGSRKVRGRLGGRGAEGLPACSTWLCRSLTPLAPALAPLGQDMSG